MLAPLCEIEGCHVRRLQVLSPPHLTWSGTIKPHSMRELGQDPSNVALDLKRQECIASPHKAPPHKELVMCREISVRDKKSVYCKITVQPRMYVCMQQAFMRAALGMPSAGRMPRRAVQGPCRAQGCVPRIIQYQAANPGKLGFLILFA